MEMKGHSLFNAEIFLKGIIFVPKWGQISFLYIWFGNLGRIQYHRNRLSSVVPLQHLSVHTLGTK